MVSEPGVIASSDTSSKELLEDLLPIEPEKRAALSRWILAVAIVNFDLDVGPVVDRMYPEVFMNSAERENV